MLLGIVFLPWKRAFSQSRDPSGDSLIQTIHYDHTEQITPISFDKEQLQNYSKDSDFDYSREKRSENWWRGFLEWLNHLWDSFWKFMIGNIQPGSWVAILLEVLKYVVIVVVLGFLVWLFYRLGIKKSLHQPKNKAGVLLSEEERILASEEIPQLILKAEKASEYRLAVRYQYLLALKQLREKELIVYQYQKTNQAYLIEIQEETLKKTFAEVTRIYEFIWYGDFEITPSSYRYAKQDFEALNTQLKRMENV